MVAIGPPWETPASQFVTLHSPSCCMHASTRIIKEHQKQHFSPRIFCSNILNFTSSYCLGNCGEFGYNYSNCFSVDTLFRAVFSGVVCRACDSLCLNMPSLLEGIMQGDYAGCSASTTCTCFTTRERLRGLLPGGW